MAGLTVYSRLRTTDFLRNFSWQFLFTLRVFARNLLRGNRRRNTFRISFWCLAWGSNPGLSSNKPTHCLLDHGDERTYDSAVFILFSQFYKNLLFYWAIINWNFIWNIDLNNGVYCDLRNKSACLNAVLRNSEFNKTHTSFRHRGY